MSQSPVKSIELTLGLPRIRGEDDSSIVAGSISLQLPGRLSRGIAIFFVFTRSTFSPNERSGGSTGSAMVTDTGFGAFIDVVAALFFETPKKDSIGTGVFAGDLVGALWPCEDVGDLARRGARLLRVTASGIALRDLALLSSTVREE
jgi:hypothetical protein